MCIPDGIRKLTQEAGPFLSNLFRKLNPTLEVLILDTNYSRVHEWCGGIDMEVMEIGLDLLTNIASFSCCELGISEEFNRFAKSNQYSITHLDIDMRCHHNIWEDVAALENLQVLRVAVGEKGPRRSSFFEIEGHSTPKSLTLPCLEELHIVIRQRDFDSESDYDTYEEEEKKERHVSLSSWRPWTELHCGPLIFTDYHGISRWDLPENDKSGGIISPKNRSRELAYYDPRITRGD